MKFRKLTILLTLLGLLLVACAAGMAQTPTQGDEKKKSEACCSMDSCCCNGDSCDVNAKHDAKNHGAKSCCNMKHKHEKQKAKNKST
jgi:hypothetical protein